MLILKKKISLLMLLLSIITLYLGGCFKKENEENIIKRDGVVITETKTEIIVTADNNLEGAEFILNKKIDKKDIVTKNIHIIKDIKDSTVVAIMDMNGYIKKGETILVLQKREDGIGINEITPVLLDVSKKGIKRIVPTGTEPKLLGDFDNDGKVGMLDFEDFVENYGLVVADTNYNELYDIDPESDNFDGEWVGIFDYAEPDGKIGIFDFEVFVHNFGKTINSLPTAPENTYPMNESTGQNANEVMLMWNASSDSEGDELEYEVLFGVSQTSMSAIEVTTNTSIMVKGLEYNTMYYWQVTVDDKKGGITSGDIWSFTTEKIIINQFPDKAINLQPLDMTTGTSISLDLSWTGLDPDGDELEYEVLFGMSQTSMSGIEVTTNTSIYIEMLDYNTTYYWQVNSDDKKGGITLGDIWSFTTEKALPQTLMEDFESGNFLKYEWEIFSYFGYEPKILNGVGIDNSYGVEFEIEAYNDVSELKIVVDVPSSTYIIFDYKVDNETDKEFLKFQIDPSGMNYDYQGNWSGNIDWKTATYPIPVGEHTLEWQYDKYESAVDPAGKAWIDNIRIGIFNEVYLYWNKVENNSGKIGDIKLYIYEDDGTGKPLGDPILFEEYISGMSDSKSVLLHEGKDYLAEFFIDVNDDNQYVGDPLEVVSFTINSGETAKLLGDISIEPIFNFINIIGSIENNTSNESNNVYFEIYKDDGMDNPTGSAIEVYNMGVVLSTTPTTIDETLDLMDSKYHGQVYIDVNSNQVYDFDEKEPFKELIFELIDGITSPTALYFVIDAENSNPNKPVLYGPGNTTEGAIDIDNEGIVLNIEEGTDPDNDPLMYEVYFGTDKIEVENAVITSSSVYLGEMFYNPNSELVDYQYTSGGKTADYNTMYYWKVIVKDGKGGVTEGDVWSFITEYETEVIGELINDTSYNVKLEIAILDKATSPSTIKPMLDKTEIITSEGAFTFNFALVKDSYIAIIYLDENNNGLFEEVEVKENQEFEVLGSSVVEIVDFGVIAFSNTPEKPNYILPIDMTTNTAINIELSWNEVIEPDGNELEYEILLGELGTTLSSIGITSMTAITVSALNYETEYGWQVVARDEYGFENKGDIWSFITEKKATKLSGTIINTSGESGDIKSLVFLRDTEGKPIGDPLFEVTPIDEDVEILGIQYEINFILEDGNYLLQAVINDSEVDKATAIGEVPFEVLSNESTPSILEINIEDIKLWKAIGNFAGDYIQPSFKIENNIPYFAYPDSNNNGYLKIESYDGSNWLDYTTENFMGARGVDLEFTTTGAAIVSYIANASTEYPSNDDWQIIVKSEETPNWKLHGGFPDITNKMSLNKAGELDLLVNENNQIYVAYNDVSSGMDGKLTVQHYDENVVNDWETLGIARFTETDGVSDISMKEYNGELYVGYRNRTGYSYKGDPTVIKYNESTNSWDKVGGGSVVIAEGTKFDFDISPTGELYVAFENKLYKYNGSIWEQIGNPWSGSSWSAVDLNLSQGIPSIVYENSSSEVFLAEYESSNGEWINKGEIIGIQKNSEYHVEVKFDSSGIPYVMYRDETSGNWMISKLK